MIKFFRNLPADKAGIYQKLLEKNKAGSPFRDFIWVEQTISDDPAVPLGTEYMSNFFALKIILRTYGTLIPAIHPFSTDMLSLLGHCFNKAFKSPIPMLIFFRKIRQKLLQQNKVTQYVAYALGEIFLVVIGILIALQVNNYREALQTKARETAFLHGLRSDLLLNLDELQRSIDQYSRAGRSAEVMISYFEGAPISNTDSLNFHTMEVLYWDPFIRNNSTLREMISSGSLGILSDDSLKNELLRMELSYDKIDGTQEHMRYDYQEYLYGPFFRTGDMGQAYKDYMAILGGVEQAIKNTNNADVIKVLLNDPAYKNGFSLCILNAKDLISNLEEMVISTQRSLTRIDIQLNKTSTL